MKKWFVIALGAAMLVAAAALLWPAAPREADDGEAAARATPSPDFTPVGVVAREEGQGLALTGTVFDPTGRPVAGAEVFLAASTQASLSTVRCSECADLLLSCPAHETASAVAGLLATGKGALAPGARTKSDAKGAFRFEHLVGVSFTLWARASGLGESVHERAAPGDPVELFLPALRTIAGLVQDDQARPIGGAKVYAVSRRLALPHEATSAPNGSFEVRGLGEGPFYVLAQADGYLAAVSPQVEAGPQPIRLTLPTPRRLEVTVRSGGRPVDARVRVSADHLAREVVARGGVAGFSRLYPDEVVVTAVFGSQSSAPQTVALSETVTRLTLELEPGGTLSVAVVDETGGPVPDPELLLSTRAGEIVAKKKAKTGELAVLGPLGQGEYFLRGTAEGYRMADLPVKVRSGDANVELVLGRGTTITGRVLDEYGRPAPGISILVTPTGDSVIADAEGRFVAQVPSPGLYSLHAHHSDWGGGQVQVTAPASGVELHLEPRAGVQVVAQSEGRRVEGANVVLWMDRDGSYRSDRPSGADGLVLMRGMPAGTYWLVAAHSDYLPSERQQVRIDEGQLAKVTAELKPGARVSGEVVDSRGGPVSGASLTVVPRGAEPAITDGLGHFELRALRPAVSYRVEARHPKYEQLERVQATAGGDPVRIVMKRKDVFQGRVLGEEGRPLKHFRVDDHEVDSADGRFELALSSADGRVIFSVESPGYEPMMVDRAVAPDIGDLILTRAPESSGTVRGADGQPIVDAVVTCDVCDESVLSGPDGRFKLSAPPYVIQYAVTARKGLLSGTATAQSGASGPIDVVISGAVKVVGLAYLTTGKPAAGVEIEGMNMDRAEPVTVVTAQDGSFATSVPAGNYRFSFIDPTDDGETIQTGFGDALAIMAEVKGPETRLDFGPVPGTGSVTVRLKPERGFGLWIVRGDVGSVGNPPIELLKASYAQLLYQPSQDKVVLAGLAPGRYTLVWGSFHVESPAGPLLVPVNVPAPGEVSLVR